MTNSVTERLMKLSLFALSFYFLTIALAHITGTKIPLLFVYFNVPSNAYQDNIISFMAFGWAVFFFAVARDPLANRQIIGALLIAAAGAVAGLSYINLTTDFAVLVPGIEIWPFWAQTALLALISLWLFVLFRLVKNIS